MRDHFPGNLHPSLRTVDHRPWPLPERDWTWRQAWLDLVFLHYRVSADRIRAMLPPGVHLQEFDGSAWVGLVPFRMSGVMRRPLPDLPPFSSFPELNLRTYVEVDGRAGVWFFSLDADCRPVVFGGRYVYNLPYFSAKIRQTRDDKSFRFTSVRRTGGVRFSASYRPVGEVFFAERGTFEHWATERYCLYACSPRTGLCRVEVHHSPWPIQHAEVEVRECGVLSAAGIEPLDDMPVCHFSAGVHVVSYAQEAIGV